MEAQQHPQKPKPKKSDHPFRKAVLRGLGVVFPPLLTILIFIWVINTTYRYVLNPVTYLAQEVIIWSGDYVKTVKDPGFEEYKVEDESKPTSQYHSQTVHVEAEAYRRIDRHSFVPNYVFVTVERDPGEPRPETAEAYCRRYLNLTCLQPQYTITLTLSVFIILLFLLGRFMAAGIGHFFVSRVERGINRLPLVRNVYSSVKQVSDFLFTERDIEYTRVVAVEYPRKGIWSLGLVTGESMLQIRSAAKEPVLSVLMPTSPMPVTGFTVTIRKSDTIDLNITIDQAFQFIISCGVVVPPQQIEQTQEPTPAALPGPDDEQPPEQPAAEEQ